MSDEYATAELIRTVTVARGVFAPGHLGGLTRYVPFELVDAVLEETRAVQRRVRLLPSRVGVYFVLALALFPGLGYWRVWDRLVAGLEGLGLARPSEAALRVLRRRLGPAPFKALFEVVAGPLAGPQTRGACYRGLRTVAFDGCSSQKVADYARNRGWLGKVRQALGWEGYPRLSVMALCETGTRGLLGAVFGPGSTGETDYARRLLGPRLLLLGDRVFGGDDFLAKAAATGAQLPIRLTARRTPAVGTRLPDGSYLTRLAGVKLRIIEAQITATTQDGRRIQGSYRLATTLLDHRRDPAQALIGLYHERWEIETAFYSLRHTLLEGCVLRSGDPAGLEQEVWALLTCYQLLRMAMAEAPRPSRTPTPTGPASPSPCAPPATRSPPPPTSSPTPATPPPRARSAARS